MEEFKFKFSLEVLNHLGRGLYRSFATVVAEAISNAWDVEATEVYITIDREKGVLEVADNGKGMNASDFQNRFLKVGYSRRDDLDNPSRRVVIGRKGIGKLAMLSISKQVKIVSKKKGGTITGGIINNGELDDAINKDGPYLLDLLNEDEGVEHDSGTKIVFEELKERMNSEDIIRKYLAMQFNFLFSNNTNEQFDIFVNGKKIGSNDLENLNEKTEFIWFLGVDNEEVKKRFVNLKKEKIIENTSFEFEGKSIHISGFIASVERPGNLTIRGTEGEFKAGVNLFCNGRLRQDNILQEITSRRVVESYLYGEIHVNDLDGDDDKIDRFTSSREGVIKDDKMYEKFLEALKENIMPIVLKDWDCWRIELREEGDPDNESIPRHKRRLMESKNLRSKDFKEKIDSLNIQRDEKNRLKDRLRSLSENNTQIYQDLFILENLYREYIKNKYSEQGDLEGLLSKKNHEQWDGICKRIEKTKKDRTKKEERHELKGNIVKEDSYLNYIDFVDLALVIDEIREVVGRQRYTMPNELDAKSIMSVRNPVMHTNEITDKVMEWNKIKNVIDYMDRIINNEENQ